MSVTVDTRGFRGMCKELQKLSGKPYPEVVRHQTAKVLETAIRFTPSVNISKAINRVQNQVRKKYNTYAHGHAGSKDQYLAGRVFESAGGYNPRISRSNGHAWWKDGEKFYLMEGGASPRRWHDSRWAAYQREEAERKLDLEEALGDVAAGIRRSRGLGKRSWFDAADELGLGGLLRVPAYAKKAIGANKRRYKNGTGKDESGTFRTLLVITNTSPIMASRGQGRAILQRAINARLKAFETELDTGVFEDVKTRASRYPGLFVHR